MTRDAALAKGGTISLLTATSLVVANMIGTGVFTSLGFQVGPLPSGFAIIVLWLLGGFCALCGALAYGELAAALPRSGGEYHLLSEIYHPAVGFLAGWISAAVGFSVPIALAAMAFGEYFAAALPGTPPLPVSLGIVAIVTAVHLRGLTLGSLFQNSATVLKLLLIIALIVAGITLGEPRGTTFFPRAGDAALIASAPFAVSLIFVMYAYSGWNASVYIAGEIRDPGRNVPRSIVTGTLFVTILYVLVNAVFLHVTPRAEILELDKKEKIAALAATHIFGAGGGRVMAGLICAGLVSSISAMTWVGPRVTMTMGEDCRALRFLATKSERGTPVAAIVAQAGVVVVLLLTATFEAVLTYIQFSLTFCSFLAVLGVIVLRRRRPELHRPYKTWGYPVTPLIFLTVSLWMMWHILRSQPRESLAGIATLLLGLGIYFISPTRPAISAR